MPLSSYMFSFVPHTPIISQVNTQENATNISLSDTPKICLNMIVKNESNIILRLLASVVALIDGYCICDTGSTDNTVELITAFFAKYDIPGKIIYEPFRDFGYNRSHAALACADIPNMDYLLLLDADMVLTGKALEPQNIQPFKTSLNADCYHVCQGSPGYYYKNVRLMRNYRGYSYWGVTHEYVSTPEGTKYGTIEIDTLFINDIGDGGAKSDKFERDIRLLKKGLEENPNNDRYTFYLANSLRDAGHIEEAIDTFRKRIEIGGWIEEIWHSHYNIGNCYKRLGQIEKAICAWVDAFNFHPKRVESLHEIVNYYRERGNNDAAYMYLSSALDSISRWGASNDFLFLQKDVYDYKLDYELSIIGYYVNHRNYNMPNTCMKVLAYPHLPSATASNVLSNYKFYVKHIVDDKLPFEQKFLDRVTDSLGLADDGVFVKSTPSVVLRGNHLIMNVRYVNYSIDDRGNYVNQEKIITKNAVAVLDIGSPVWQIVQEFELKYDTVQDGRYVGLEDIRLFIQDGKVLYNANRGIKYESTMTVEHGIVSLEYESTKESTWPKIENQHTIEKNWIMCPPSPPSESPRVIYNWNPQLIIGEFVENKFVEKRRNPTPAFFKYLRGSTNGVVIKGEIWVICHAVSYEERRNYYHIVVVLDEDTLEIRRYTPFFTFEGGKVEYTLGFVYLESDDSLFIGYSLYDKCAKYVKMSRDYFENQMIENS
jgi:glycosyltransferase involved in cell wall biosynthesis